MQAAGYGDKCHLVLGNDPFFHSETGEGFIAFTALYEPFMNGLAPYPRFDGLGDWWYPQPEPVAATVLPGIYGHFKHPGNFYRVFGEYTHVDTGEIFVAYVGLYRPFAHLVRPKAMFTEIVDKPERNYHGPRFTLIRPC